MSKQTNFRLGQIVRIKKLPESMAHFPQNCRAIIINREINQFNEYIYGLFILKKPYGSASWYYNENLKLLDGDSNNGTKLLDKYEDIVDKITK